MSLRSSLLVFTLVGMACGGDGKRSNEPQTAKEKLRLQAEEEGEADAGGSKNWGRWRYKGDRSQCFFVVGSKCFKSEAAACSAAKCKPSEKCRVEGAAPAQVACI
ncbi:MAG: hypothetical protein SFX73_13220 [Kofleriaceae bacterium]|nr:hypothetical protein [Kofleriaceae bacterium]